MITRPSIGLLRFVIASLSLAASVWMRQRSTRASCRIDAKVFRAEPSFQYDQIRVMPLAQRVLEVFDDLKDCPSYAILSHRWVHGHEVSFEDMQRPHRQFMPAWPKIKMCCEQALADDLRYAWIDTCCIDKSSSSELSEAINSMYKWYAYAKRCYVYLYDVDVGDIPCADGDVLDPRQEVPQELSILFSGSKWFTRAWTLQELIAPPNVIFYDASFRRIGTKFTLASTIEARTLIPADLLCNPRRLNRYPIAIRMSWAARREATRTEDIAYSLFGLFSVNLPLLYGEGSRAFIRLQEEVIRQTHDHSIFIWSIRNQLHPKYEHLTDSLPLLALSPKDFRLFPDLRISTDNEDIRPFAMTNIGLQIELKVHPYDLDVYVGLLNCESASTKEKYGILLARDVSNRSLWRRRLVRGADIVSIDHLQCSKPFFWQNMYIARDDSTFVNDDDDDEMISTDCIPFYGLNLDLPDFLNYSVWHERPYSLVAHHDWNEDHLADNEHDKDPRFKNFSELFNLRSDSSEDTTFQARMSVHIPNPDARLTPSSHLIWSQSIDQLLSNNIGLRRLRSKSNHGDSTLASVSNPMAERLRTQKMSSRSRTDPSGVTNAPLAIGVLAMPMMSSGTAGIIVFDHLTHGIKSIKAGFDFDFKPIILLATYEAELDGDIILRTQRARYHKLETFEGPGGMLDRIDLRSYHGFWRLAPEQFLSQADSTPRDDGSILIEKGVYAFTCGSTAESTQWTFKPYETRHWHLALNLEKRRRDGLLYWEFSMDVRKDPVRITIELVE